MTARLKLVATLLFLCASTVAVALGVEVCPIDTLNMQWTGNTRQVMGKTLAEYRCANGHVSWIVVN